MIAHIRPFGQNDSQDVAENPALEILPPAKKNGVELIAAPDGPGCLPKRRGDNRFYGLELPTETL